MESLSKNNDSSSKFSKRVLFNSRTFNSKLFLKLTTPYIAESIVSIQTLRYEQENRKLHEIEKAIPWLKTFPDLTKFINLKETPESSHKLLIEFTWVLFYKYLKKNIILKRASENEEFFYVLLGGKILRLNIIYEKESVTIEEYLIYLFKLKIIHEKEILHKCRLLNNFYADIDGENLQSFCKENPQFNYEKLREMAKSEIINLGFRIEDFQEEKINIHSVEDYMKILSVKSHIRLFNNGIKATPRLYIGKYVKSGYILKGQSIGNLTKELLSDNSTYISIENCDIGFINKKQSNLKILCKLIVDKKIRILTEFKKDFFIFNKITDNIFNNEIVPHFEYKQFHQGEKIFIQGSLYEGIYLIEKGEVNIYLNSSVNDIGNYISKIKYSLCGFKEYISILNMKKKNPNDEILVKPKIIDEKTSLTKEKRDILNEINKYDIITIPEYSIFGTNELYDYKTGLYYFSAECISKETIVYFLPKKYFYSLLIKEKPILLSLMGVVESKAKYIIGKLKYHIKCFESVINKKNKKFQSNKFNTLNLNEINCNVIKSIKDLRKNNLAITENIINNKKCENSFELPVVKDSKFTLNKESNIFGQTISSFQLKNKYHKSIREKDVFSNYKKINLNMIHRPSPLLAIYNKKGKSFDGKYIIKEEKNKIKKKFKISLPNNFPFNVQNSFYNLTLYPKEKFNILKNNIII
jgi:CRP-like cAMP-binding protein